MTSAPDPAATTPAAFDLESTPIHLGLGATAEPLEGFEWSPEHLAAYDERTAGDGDDGRLVTWFRNAATWDSWERHPAGAEVVLLVSGRVVLIQELEDGRSNRVELQAGQYAINPPGTWHTVDVIEPGDGLFITPGRGTEHRPR